MDKKTFNNILNEKILIADGAMGSELYQQGFFINCSYDEINISKPEAVEDIHIRYIQAGADFITTNSFGANAIRLGKFALAEKTVQINASAVEIAKKAVDNSQILIAGSVGPTGIGNKLNKANRKAISAAFDQQIQALADNGADFLILETFTEIHELELAITSAAKTSLPVVAQLAISDSASCYHQKKLFSQLSKNETVDVVGLNCVMGPAQMLESLDIITAVSQKPISIQPNAGLPKNVDGRVIYVSSPEYMAEYAKRFFEKGAKIIGGCCGTTPEHIQQIAKAVKALDKSQHSRITISADSEHKAVNPKVDVIPLEKRSKLGEKLANGEKIYTIEITPPRSIDTSKTLEKAKLCKEHGIDAVNIPDGPRASSRISAAMTALQIQDQIGIETITHFCCRDRNLIATQSDLLGMASLKLNNLLIITGDPPKLGHFPNATAVFDLDSISLCKVADSLNNGIDIASDPISPATSFTIGVGANPASTEMDRELERFKQKVTSGADYAITQPVFDPDKLLKFIDNIKDFNIPVIAGIWPFTSYKNAHFMANEVPGVYVPEDILKRMASAATAKEGKLTGLKIAKEMIDAVKDKVAGFALSAPFGNVNIALAALDRTELKL